MSVPSLTKAEFDDVLQNRLLLEGEAAERGALRMGPAERQVLADLVTAMEHALVSNDAKAYLDANEEFHVRLYRAAGSPMLMTLIETVWLKVGPLSNQLFDDNPESGVLNDAHTDIADGGKTKANIVTDRGKRCR